MKTYSGKVDKKVIWMREYQLRLVTAVPEMQGKVCWNTAQHLYNQGMAASDAAEKVAKNLQAKA